MAIDHERMDRMPQPPLAGNDVGLAQGTLKSGRSRSRALHALTPQEAEVVEALTERLIPGASDVGVVEHIDRELAREAATLEVQPPTIETYRTGIQLVQRHSEARFGCPVQRLSDAQCDAVLWDMLEGAMDGFEQFSPMEFFRILRRHTAEGMLRDFS